MDQDERDYRMWVSTRNRVCDLIAEHISKPHARSSEAAVSTRYLASKLSAAQREWLDTVLLQLEEEGVLRRRWAVQGGHGRDVWEVP